jgi:hypothetical protein
METDALSQRFDPWFPAAGCRDKELRELLLALVLFHPTAYGEEPESSRGPTWEVKAEPAGIC